LEEPLIKISAINSSFIAPLSEALEISLKPITTKSAFVLKSLRISSILSVSCKTFTLLFNVAKSLDFRVSKIALSVPELACMLFILEVYLDSNDSFIYLIKRSLVLPGPQTITKFTSVFFKFSSSTFFMS